MAMVAVQVTGLQITWTRTADGRAAGRRHLVRSCLLDIIDLSMHYGADGRIRTCAGRPHWISSPTP